MALVWHSVLFILWIASIYATKPSPQQSSHTFRRPEAKIPALQEAKCDAYKAHDVVKEERVSKHMQVTFAILEPHHPSRPKAVWGGECPQGPVDESADQIKKAVSRNTKR